jgi:hypothetical protein
MPGFSEVVDQAWGAPTTHVEPCHILFHKLKHTAKALTMWSHRLFSNTKVMVHAALLVILHLDLAQETRALNDHERDLWAKLKRKVIALAVVERSRKKQSARIANIKEGDANTKFFHLRVNARRRKNHIQRLKHNNGWVTEHGAKEDVIHNHFNSVMGPGNARTIDFNWNIFHFEEPNLASMGDPFAEEEVHKAINQMPSDKAPGAFFKRCWGTIKHDVMKVIERFGDLHVHDFHWLNSTNIALLPKKDGTEDVSDFRPISHIHAIAKIIAKMLALRLAPFMDELI